MDLAKIIIELRAELQCLDTAIASIEELARVQNIAEAHVRPPSESDPVGSDPVPPEPVPENTPPVKRRRGRPRKSETEDPLDAGSATPDDDPTASAAPRATLA